MSVDKNLFKLEDGGSFRPDYYEEYKGYQFAISLSYHGTRDAAVVFPEGVNVKDYLNIEISEFNGGYAQTIKENWFYDLVKDTFMAMNGDAQELPTGHSILTVNNVGLYGGGEHVLMVREKDWASAAEKYVEDFKRVPEVKEQFDKFRAFHNEIENKVDADDHSGWEKLVPEGVNEILDLSQDDVIKICHDFIDAVINHEDCSAKHATLLNTIKSAKNKAWRTKK